MPYSTQSDLLIEMSESQLAKLTGDLTGLSINETRVDEAILTADAIINAALLKVYKLPFSEPIDDIIRRISISLTVYTLYEFNASRAIIPNEVITRKDFALSQLIKLQKRELHIAALANTTNSSNIMSNKCEDDKLFSHHKLGGFYGN